MGNSLIFAAASSQYLSATGNTSINQQKFTDAFWFKLATSGGVRIFYAYSDGTSSNRFEIGMASSQFQIINETAGTINLNKITTATYTDTVSWHHCVLAVDTTQAVAANRVRLYVDAVEVVAFGTNTIPSQNTKLSNNFSNTYSIGSQNSFSAGNFYNGNIAELYYIDGQQLDPTFFTQTIGGNLYVAPYSGSYTGAFDFYLNFSNGTSTTTLGQDNSGEGNNWTLNTMTTANQSTDYPPVLPVPNNAAAVAGFSGLSNVVRVIDAVGF